MKDIQLRPVLIDTEPGAYLETFTASDGTVIRVGGNCVHISREGHTVHTLNEDGGAYQELELRGPDFDLFNE